MGTALVGETLRARVARAFHKGDREVAGHTTSLPLLDCVADVQISEADVVEALQALTGIPSLRRYRTGSSSLPRARGNLVEALRAAYQDAKRSPHDVGVAVLEAHGSADHLSAVYGAIAPHVKEGSYVQVEAGGDRRYWTFEGGLFISHEGVHPQVRARDFQGA